MGQTLSNGLYLPDEGERNSYAGLEANWRTLDALILTVDGKAAPNVANTWTAAQTFTAGIIGDLTGNVTGNVTGNLTGTASRAIADEDGTSIKTGYVNVAGNQTVTGQKTWSGNQFFTSAVYHNTTTYATGNIPVSNIVTNIYLADKNSVYLGYLRNVIYTSGRTATEIRAKNAFKNGVLDPTGADISSNLNVEVQPNGAKTIYWDGLIRNDVTPFTTNNNSLGSSTNQWSSVYAQTYYYNGTAWGLDKANVWTGSNRFRNFGVQSANTIDITQSTYANSQNCGGIGFSDAVNRFWGDIELNVKTDATSEMVFNLSNWKADGAQGVSALRFRYDKTLTTVDFFGADRVVNLGTSTNKWKTINGLNPGALSLPNIEASINIAGDITDFTGATQVSLSSISIGWVYIQIPNVQGDYIEVQVGNTASIRYFVSAGYSDSLGFIEVLVPKPQVVAKVRVKATGGAVSKALFYPCLGNV